MQKLPTVGNLMLTGKEKQMCMTENTKRYLFLFYLPLPSLFRSYQGTSKAQQRGEQTRSSSWDSGDGRRRFFQLQ